MSRPDRDISRPNGLLAVLVAVAVTVLLLDARPTHAPEDLLIVAGQSNAVGQRSDASRYPVAPWLDWRIPFYAGGRWTVIGPQFGLMPYGHFGPEVTLARRYLIDGYDVGVFKFARASTSLANDWRPGDQMGMLAEMLRSLKRAAPAARPRCFVWIQGEGDAETDASASEYETKLRRLVEEVRRVLPNVPIVLGLDEEHPLVLERPIVISAQQQIAADTPLVRRVSLLGLSKDQFHLTAEGTLSQGERIYEACRALGA